MHLRAVPCLPEPSSRRFSGENAVRGVAAAVATAAARRGSSVRRRRLLQGARRREGRRRSDDSEGVQEARHQETPGQEYSESLLFAIFNVFTIFLIRCELLSVFSRGPSCLTVFFLCLI